MNKSESMRKLDKILSLQPNAVVEMLEQAKGQKIFLYGAGNVGGQMLEVLRRYDLEPAAFLDRNAAEGQIKDDVPVLRPDDRSLSRDTRKNSLVFVSILLDREPRLALCESLKAMGYLYFKYAFPWVMRGKPIWEKTLNTPWKNSAFNAFDLLEEEESQNIYAQNLSALLFGDDGDGFAASSNEVQYFDRTIPIRKNNARFVDCGAFTGDTLEALCSNLESIDAYAGFEPMPSNLEQLTSTMTRLKNRIGTGVVFPCAVGARNDIFNFLDASSSSRAKEGRKEGIAVPVVRLDDTLGAFRPTCIKMDIEGAEIDALNGARQIIIQDKPDLAICVYHAIEHYWAVPLLLRSWVKEYKFYLRTYHFGGMETVLYAVAPLH